MAKRDDASASGKSRAGAAIDAVADVVVDAKGAVTPLSKGAAKELRRLEKRLTSARKTESKRLRQLAAALASQGPEAGHQASQAGHRGGGGGRRARREDGRPRWFRRWIGS